MGVERAILWQKLIQLGAIWLFGWFANRLVKLVARRIERSVDDGDEAILSAAEFENQFVVGDIVRIGEKTGTVERMTLRIVTLRDVEGAIHIIPYGSIAMVSNLTRGWSRAVVDIAVGYAGNVDRALDVVRDELAVFRRDPAWAARLDGTSEVLGVDKLGDSGLTIRTLVRTVAGFQWEAAREFQRRLKNRLDAEGLEIPTPQRTVHVRHHGSKEGSELLGAD